MEIIDLKAFTREIKTIFDILAENGYIDCINKNDTTNKPLAYVRREHVEIKSITGKKLLTLALSDVLMYCKMLYLFIQYVLSQYAS